MLDRKKLNIILAAKGLNLASFSRVSGISYQTLICLSTGRRKGRLETIVKIAKALDCKVEDLIEM